MTSDKIFKINGDKVNLNDLAVAWLTKAERFTSVPWSDPQSKLSAADYAKVCLIDLNEPGKEKTKNNLKLPVRSTPGGPYNVNGLKAAGAALVGARGGVKAPDEAKRKAARTVVRLLRSAGVEVGSEALLSLAGQTAKEMEVKIIAKDIKKQVAYGIILRPNVPDADGDIYDEEEVEKAAWNYQQRTGGATDWLHEEEMEKEQVALVETVIMGCDVTVWHGAKCNLRKGDWLGGAWYNDQYWSDVESGKITAFSIKGYGRREEL